MQVPAHGEVDDGGGDVEQVGPLVDQRPDLAGAHALGRLELDRALGPVNSGAARRAVVVRGRRGVKPGDLPAPPPVAPARPGEPPDPEQAGQQHDERPADGPRRDREGAHGAEPLGEDRPRDRDRRGRERHGDGETFVRLQPLLLEQRPGSWAIRRARARQRAAVGAGVADRPGRRARAGDLHGGGLDRDRPVGADRVPEHLGMVGEGVHRPAHVVVEDVGLLSGHELVGVADAAR